MAFDDPLQVMRRETRVRHGRVPEHLDGEPVPEGMHRMGSNAFQLRDRGLACHYARGEGITVQLDDPAEAPSLELFLAGTVHAVVAAMNGLMPLHASAVAAGEHVIAFTGDAGAGKSTTAAALSQRGFPLFADDTLVIDPAVSPPRCHPGHKRLKLWPDALTLTGLPPQEMVADDYRKFFATSTGSAVDHALPLGAIVVLTQGEEPAFEAIRGAARIAALDDDHYTSRLHAQANGLGQGQRLTLLAGLANTVPLYRFTRPFDAARFSETVDLLVESLSGIGAA